MSEPQPHINLDSGTTSKIPPGGWPTFPEQNEDGVDLSLIRRNLDLSPTERLRRCDRARRDALRLQYYGQKHREKSA